MQRLAHVSAAPTGRYDALRRLRHTILYRLDGSWTRPGWQTLGDIRKGEAGAPKLPGRPLEMLVAVLVRQGLVEEGPEVCLDGACMYKVRQYKLTAAGHVALAQSFARLTEVWTEADAAETEKITEARKRAARRLRRLP